MKLISELLCLTTLVLLLGCGGPFTGPRDVALSDPAKAVADARRLINEKRAEPEAHEGWISPSKLPESLRLPGLRYAQVFDDHVNLVLARNPDWQIGARIWSQDSTREHQDQKTQYEDVFFFDYTNDSQESPTNIK